MDATEKWLVDQAHEYPEGEIQDAILVVATHWHHEGQDIMKQELAARDLPTSHEEWETHRAFYRLTVIERDQAREEVKRLEYFAARYLGEVPGD